MSVQFTNPTEEEKLWGMLGYIPFVGWIIAVVALLMEDKKSHPYIKFHAAQSLALAIINGVVAGVLSFVLIGICTGIAGVVYMCYIGYKAYVGETVIVPFITDFVQKNIVDKI